MRIGVAAEARVPTVAGTPIVAGLPMSTGWPIWTGVPTGAGEPTITGVPVVLAALVALGLRIGTIADVVGAGFAGALEIMGRAPGALKVIGCGPAFGVAFGV